MARRSHDWDAIYKDYSLGQMSFRAIAAKHGLSHSAIHKRAQEEQWVQDKTFEVRAKTRAALAVDSVRAEQVDKVDTAVNQPRPEATPAEIEAAVEVNLRVVREHRKAIKRGQQLVQVLSQQLSSAAEHRDDLVADVMADTSLSTKERYNYLKAVQLPTHSGVLRDLTLALKNLIPLERQAYSLDEAGAGLGSPDAIVIEFRRNKPPEESDGTD